MKKKNSKVISLQEIVSSFGISYQTLNYYTSLGLLHTERRQGNKRLYDAKDVRQRLGRIDKLKNEGYPLRIICNIINGHKRAV
ncbi:MAG: MerR family transcriptional regulator [Candidatus Omnitrophota bacterium]